MVERTLKKKQLSYSLSFISIFKELKTIDIPLKIPWNILKYYFSFLIIFFVYVCKVVLLPFLITSQILPLFFYSLPFSIYIHWIPYFLYVINLFIYINFSYVKYVCLLKLCKSIGIVLERLIISSRKFQIEKCLTAKI